MLPKHPTTESVVTPTMDYVLFLLNTIEELKTFQDLRIKLGFKSLFMKS